MITLEIGGEEYYDSATSSFIYDERIPVRFEYSLKVIYDWEFKWRKPFLKGELTERELIDFYMTMAIDPIEEKHLTEDIQLALVDYIQDSSTATTFSTPKSETVSAGKPKAKIYTSEELYALMFSAGVPIDFENRNLNRLLVILRIIGSYNSPPKKMSKQDVVRQNADLNRQRKAQLNTRG